MRLAMPDGAVMGIQIEGARTGATTSYDGRIVDVDNRQHLKALREYGAFPVNVGGRTVAAGYRCTCGFASFFKTCGRCGDTCAREESQHA